MMPSNIFFRFNRWILAGNKRFPLTTLAFGLTLGMFLLFAFPVVYHIWNYHEASWYGTLGRELIYLWLVPLSCAIILVFTTLILRGRARASANIILCIAPLLIMMAAHYQITSWGWIAGLPPHEVALGFWLVGANFMLIAIMWVVELFFVKCTAPPCKRISLYSALSFLLSIGLVYGLQLPVRLWISEHVSRTRADSWSSMTYGFNWLIGNIFDFNWLIHLPIFLVIGTTLFLRGKTRAITNAFISITALMSTYVVWEISIYRSHATTGWGIWYFVALWSILMIVSFVDFALLEKGKC